MGSLAETVLRRVIARISNLRMVEPPKRSADSLRLVFALERTDAREGQDWRVWINGPDTPMTESQLFSYFGRELALQGF